MHLRAHLVTITQQDVYQHDEAYSYRFLNWIFFDKQVRQEWHNVQFFLFILEAVTLFPVLLVMLYTTPSRNVIAGSLLGVIVLIKSLLLFKSIRLFYVKTYGVLHLFVYFCTLEVIPALLLWRALLWAAGKAAIQYLFN